MDRPDQIRNLLVNDVRDAYAPIYEDLSVILAPSKGQGESVPRPTSPLFGFLVVALIAGSLIVSYHYSALDSLIDSIQSFAHSMLKGG